MQPGTVTFEDVAVRFSLEEWVALETWQRELYWEVTMDTRDLVASLGPQFKLIHKMEPGEEPRGGVPYGGGDGGAPDAASTSACARLASTEPPGPKELGCQAPSVSPAAGSGHPALWREVEPGGRHRDTPREPAAAGGGPLICGACGWSAEAEAVPGEHWEHRPRPAPSHQCRACGKAFRHHRNLLTHKKHRGRRHHICTECGRAFCLKGDLLRHRAGHGGEGIRCCPLCGHAFRHRHRPRAHSREHGHGEGDGHGNGHGNNHGDGNGDAARHVCPRCERRFEDEAGLGQHRTVCGREEREEEEEEEERPFRCGRCGRSFSWKESLLIHQRSHAPERSHKCPDCGRGFSRSGNLLVHQRVHTGERPFACPHCDKAFCNKANLTTHKKLHRRYAAFACAQCRLGFSSKSKLRLHRRQVHGDGGDGGNCGDEDASDGCRR